MMTMFLFQITVKQFKEKIANSIVSICSYPYKVKLQVNSTCDLQNILKITTTKKLTK